MTPTKKQFIISEKEKFMMKFINSLKHIDITENLDLEKIFITSDLHLFHQNIIDYVNRPFEFFTSWM